MQITENINRKTGTDLATCGATTSQQTIFFYASRVNCSLASNWVGS
jgi:hypothetical protein